ncbi:MAG: transcriptional regulator [Rhodovulum sulfidophilum]|uniref:Transcriptional regulator n=1 Tax=Rhodovulum sulfidophilum TaxID=35806 RepID=A0A2W5NIY5_RHOSU|nr:MAG: transcriptional regulator [Rhodovulum sulfidophilum]
MAEEQTLERGEILSYVTTIVAAYAGNNAIEATALTDLIGGVFAKLNELVSDEEPSPEALVPAVPIRRSVTDDYLICLEDGKKLKMLKRHLMTTYGLTPDEYRAKWGLRSDYPMVAPNYAEKRKELAKAIGLGRKPRTADEAAPEPAKPRARGRKPAA